ncbi:hypothetical protein PV328_001113 [Microctonus aethiopoides]|uniref:Uncharacterized protein n=1 Tax=Microctonus aethiopoides TaxID=144406 RepID=A0AA39FW94_9HYME|nr:hypothetical protein PV328_001113 [Microctonus aethiopoides]
MLQECCYKIPITFHAVWVVMSSSSMSLDLGWNRENICLIKQIVPKVFLTILASMCTPISALSKIVQLFAVIRAKNSESVSLLTWTISVFTNITRVYTIWMDSADVVLLGNFIISGSNNVAAKTTRQATTLKKSTDIHQIWYMKVFRVADYESGIRNPGNLHITNLMKIVGFF